MRRLYGSPAHPAPLFTHPSRINQSLAIISASRINDTSPTNVPAPGRTSRSRPALASPSSVPDTSSSPSRSVLQASSNHRKNHDKMYRPWRDSHLADLKTDDHAESPLPPPPSRPSSAVVRTLRGSTTILSRWPCSKWRSFGTYQ